MRWQDRDALSDTLALLVAAGASSTEPNREGVSARQLLESRSQQDLVAYLNDLETSR
jgi:hypothetical protein